MTNYVLIVDDDPEAREALANIVRGLGLIVKIADNGQSALEMVREHRPAMILLDLMMPRMDGFNTLGRLRCIPRTRNVPVIVVTAAPNNDRLSLMLPGVVAVVSKETYTVEGLTQLIARTLAANSVNPMDGTMSGAVSDGPG